MPRGEAGPTGWLEAIAEHGKARPFAVGRGSTAGIVSRRTARGLPMRGTKS